MSKYVNVPNGDYKLKVQDGGEITLDTGLNQGTVIITGNLLVAGTQTTLNTTDTDIEDNIITLNAGETGTGITLGTSGIQIDRGSIIDAQFVFDESIDWRDPVTETTISGAFHAKLTNGNTVAIRTNSIDTGGGDLYLINSGTGVISVTGASNYERNVFDYLPATNTINLAGGAYNGAIDEDLIPNAKGVVDYITSYFAGVFQARIAEGTITPTYVEASDFEVSGSTSVVEIGVDNNLVASFYEDRLELTDLRIEGTTIETITSGSDLTLGVAGSGSVIVNDNLVIKRTLAAPNDPVNGLKLYVEDVGAGDTGLYYIDDNSNNDELVSKNRSLLFSMIF